MSTDLIVVERELMPAFAPVMPTFAQLLPPEIPPERLMRTIVVSCMNNNYLLKCNRQSLVNSALSAACLGLECDGIAGQGYLVPFGRSAQFVCGYKGYITIAARSGYTLEGFVVLEGDEFTFDEGHATWEHRRVLGRESERAPVAFYAVSRKPGASTILRVMSDDQVRETRDKSDGFKAFKAGKIKSNPWHTHYVPMGMKTTQRTVAKALPMLTMQQAAMLETQHDLGHRAHLDVQSGAVVVDGALAPEPTAAAEPRPQPGPEILEGEVVVEDDKPWVITYPAEVGGATKGYESLQDYRTVMSSAIDKAGKHRAAFRAANEEFILGPVTAADESLASSLLDAFAAHD